MVSLYTPLFFGWTISLRRTISFIIETFANLNLYCKLHWMIHSIVLLLKNFNEKLVKVPVFPIFKQQIKRSEFACKSSHTCNSIWRPQFVVQIFYFCSEWFAIFLQNICLHLTQFPVTQLGLGTKFCNKKFPWYSFRYSAEESAHYE